jgi:hypothetical protein
MKRYSSGKIGKGLLIGAIVPFAGYLLAYGVFDFLGRMSDSGGFLEYSSDFRPRTIALVGLMFNLIPFHYYIREGETRTVRGVVVPTLVYAFIWFFYFRDSIFS